MEPGNIFGGIRHNESLADLLAVHYLQVTAQNPGVPGRARNLLAKLQFVSEPFAEEKSDHRLSTHPGYAERLALFDSTRFELAARQEPIRTSPFRDDAFAIAVMAKVEEERRTAVYLLIKGTDVVNREWRISALPFAELMDGQGGRFELQPGDLCYRIDSGDNVIVRAEVGGTGAYRKLDLRSAPLQILALP